MINLLLYLYSQVRWIGLKDEMGKLARKKYKMHKKEQKSDFKHINNAVLQAVGDKHFFDDNWGFGFLNQPAYENKLRTIHRWTAFSFSQNPLRVSSQSKYQP